MCCRMDQMAFWFQDQSLRPCNLVVGLVLSCSMREGHVQRQFPLGNISVGLNSKDLFLLNARPLCCLTNLAKSALLQHRRTRCQREAIGSGWRALKALVH